MNTIVIKTDFVPTSYIKKNTRIHNIINLCGSFREEFKLNGEFDREDVDKPSIIVNSNVYDWINWKWKKLVTEEQYYKDCVLHRDNNLPAIIEHNIGGNKECELFYKEGILHRDEGPAEIRYDTINGITYIRNETYFKNGLIHRNKHEGPASIRYHLRENGTTCRGFYLYYENGEIVRSCYDD